ncbi:SWPV1-122 [Shearwaterpox virus]|uniref:SWPV1-122 n=1 Tax=Shearwaterpox virus TaxID=1974596 RepID=A0A1V0S7X3_CNPV|nr:SWPV1-122 [Shearwaterpox virus]
MTIIKRIRKLFGMEKSKSKKRIPSMYVSELDLSKGYMVIADINKEKIVNIDLYDQKGLASNRLSRSCSDINNKIVYKDNIYTVEMRKLIN